MPTRCNKCQRKQTWVGRRALQNGARPRLWPILVGGLDPDNCFLLFQVLFRGQPREPRPLLWCGGRISIRLARFVLVHAPLALRLVASRLEESDGLLGTLGALEGEIRGDIINPSLV